MQHRIEGNGPGIFAVLIALFGITAISMTVMFGLPYLDEALRKGFELGATAAWTLVAIFIAILIGFLAYKRRASAKYSW